MKLRKKEGIFNINIRRVWYKLCCCTNCNEVHAFHPILDERGNSGLWETDKVINCCNKPDNHCEMEGAEEIIEEFVRCHK